MATMTKSWTDERLEERFDRIDQRFDAVDRRFDKVDRQFEKVDADIRDLRGEMNTRFDALHQTIFRFGGAALIALLGLVVTQL